VLLHFGAVNYWSMVWVNGKLAGSHEGGNTPFTFDVTPLLQPGANVLTVRAHFPPTDRYIPRGKQFWEPKSKSIFYTRTSGIWQPVWMEPVGASYLDRVKITPAHTDGAVRLEFDIARPQPDLEITASASFAGQPAASATAHTGRPRAPPRCSPSTSPSFGRHRRPICTTSRWNCGAAACCSIACRLISAFAASPPRAAKCC
jgi:hypothetical protein